MSHKFKGTGVALVTPFLEDGKLDIAGLEKLVEHVISGGVNYVVPLGTTGESVTLNKTEKKIILETVLAVNAGRVPTLVGIGGNNTAEVIAAIQEGNFKGVDGVLSVSPYYSKPSQRGIIEHYKAIAKASPVPIVLYNVPGRTASNLSYETTIHLANEVKNIVAIKEASGNFDQFMSVIKNRPSGFELISGDDNYTLPVIAAGAIGVISVVANVLPKEFSSMVNLCLEQKFAEARTFHYRLFNLVNLLFAEGNPSGAKAALSILGICKNTFRLPVVGVSSELMEKIRAEIIGIQKT